MVWAAPLALIPYLAWKRRSNRLFVLNAGAAYLVCIISLVLLLRMFSQPYAPLELSKRQMAGLAVQNGAYAGFMLLDAALSCLLCSLPALVSLNPRWKELGIVRLIGCGVLATTATAFTVTIFGIRHGLAPFLGNIVSPYGILSPGEDALGIRPAVLPFFVRIGLTWFLFFSLACVAHLVVMKRLSLASMPAVVFTIFSCLYMSLLFPGALLGMTFDRYLLPLFPLLVISILRSFRSCSQPISGTAWVCLILFGTYATATSHDYFSGLRARVLAAHNLESQGIRRDHISAEFDYDGWTQLELLVRLGRYSTEKSSRSGHMNFGSGQKLQL